MTQFRKKIKKVGLTFKDYKIDTAHGFVLINGKEFGDIPVNFICLDFDEMIASHGWAKLVPLFERGYMCQICVMIIDGVSYPQYGKISKAIDNPITINQLNNDFIRNAAEKMLFTLNNKIAERQLLNKQGTAYKIFTYLKKCRSQTMPVARILKMAQVSKQKYVPAIRVLEFLGYVKTDGLDACWSGKDK